MERGWSFGMHTPTNDPRTWEYWVAWGTSYRKPLIYLTFPTWEEVERIGPAIMDAAKRENSGGHWMKY